MRPPAFPDGVATDVLAHTRTAAAGAVVGIAATALLVLPLAARALPADAGPAAVAPRLDAAAGGGATSTTAGESAVALAENRVVQAAAAALEAHLATRTDAFRVRPRPPPAGTSAPEPDAHVAVRPLAATVPVETRMRVWVDVHAAPRDGGRFLRSVPVACDVAATSTAWIATRDVPAGTPIVDAIQGGALHRERTDIAVLRATPATAWPDAARLRRTLRAGDALVASHLESAPAVARGDTVSLVVRGGPIGIEARAEALQDGARGAAVWVRVAQATAPVRARVVDVATVEVLP